MRKLLAATVTALAVAAASYLIPGASADPAEPARPSTIDAPTDPRRLPEVDRLIDVFETRVSENQDALDMWTLGAHYLDRASITGDVSDYQSAAEVLEQAHETNAGNRNVDIPLASARLALHDFIGARELAEPFATGAAVDVEAVAISGDAALAYGDVEAAARFYDILRETAPRDPAVAVRLASLDWDLGNRDAAITQARHALDLAAIAPAEIRAFYTTYVGLLLLETGQYEDARRTLEDALQLNGTYVPAMIELGHVLAAQGQSTEAIAILEQSLSLGPEPEVAALLGDLYALEGDEERATDRYARVESLAAKAPEAYRRDVSRFLSDHRRDPGRAFQLAEEGLTSRRDSGAYDTLAWALYRHGRFEEARKASDLALSLGTSDASAYYHAGAISLALGEEKRGLAEVARALEMNPHFHPLLSIEAQELLDRE